MTNTLWSHTNLTVSSCCDRWSFLLEQNHSVEMGFFSMVQMAWAYQTHFSTVNWGSLKNMRGMRQKPLINMTQSKVMTVITVPLLFHLMEPNWLHSDRQEWKCQPDRTSFIFYGSIQKSLLNPRPWTFTDFDITWSLIGRLQGLKMVWRVMGRHLYHIALTMPKHSHKDSCWSSLFAVMEANLSVLEELLLFPAVYKHLGNHSSLVDYSLTLLTSARNIIN